MGDPIHLRREYRPDLDRCIKALTALLRWEPPPAPEVAAEDHGGAGEDPREDRSAPEENTCRGLEDRQGEE